MRRKLCLGFLAFAAPQICAGADLSAYLPTLSDFAAAPAAPTRPTTPVNLTLYWENDGGPAKKLDSHDRHYTAGIAISLAARPAWAKDVAAWIPSFYQEFDPRRDDTRFAVGLIAVQDIYTPEHYQQSTPDPTDWPYGGFLYAGFYLQRARYAAAPHGTEADARTLASYDHLELDLGMVGPSSLARESQELVHGLFNYTRPKGWNYQLHDEPSLDVKYVHKWRLSLEPPSAFLPTAQAIPDVGLIAGTVHRELDLGSTFRIVWGPPPDDFGPTRIDLPGAFTGAYTPPFNLALFARPALRLVEHNTLLQGNTWRSSDITQQIEPFVGEFQFGVTAQFFSHLEVGYSWTFKTREFKQQSGSDSFGAWTISAVWAF